MANAYFTLTSSTGVSKKFAVIQSGYQPGMTKTQTEQITLDGRPDISMGTIIKRHIYTVKVRESEPRDGFGDKADLEWFYSLNNPLGTPSNKLTLTDHFGTQYDCYIVGDHVPSPLSAEIEGETAWYYVQCTFRLVDK